MAIDTTSFERLVLGDERLRVFNDTVPAGILVVRVEDGGVLFVNRFFKEVLGMEGAGVLGDTWRELFVDPSDRERLMLSFVAEGVVRNFELRLRRPDGRHVWGLVSLADIPIEGEDLLLFAFVDISALKEAEEEIRKLANHDALTGLPTLRLFKDLFIEAASRANRNGGQFAILFVDLDGFKGVNDTLGHGAGDHVLQEMARTFLQCVRGTDKVARIGGDEFVVLCEKITRPMALKIARRIVEGAGSPMTVAGREVRIGASVGIALYPANGTSLDALMKAADDAMYRVKHSTKGAVAIADAPSRKIAAEGAPAG
ncbi:MAG: GGDEF domain-containing protein [Rhodospirillales bacterium]|nr:GGDEF domain-containing protein [Rhodospirillales bacterium]